MTKHFLAAWIVCLTACILPAAELSGAFTNGLFAWRASNPLIDAGPARDAADPVIAIKDPTVVFHDKQWHLFATVRMKSGQVCMQYLHFDDWAKAAKAERHLLKLHNQYHCAPQVFYFTPHKKWYLIYQCADTNRVPAFGPCFSTTDTLSDPDSWTPPQLMVTNVPAKPKWLDFWVICDQHKAHLFYTSLDGNLWRRETRKADFPWGWSEQKPAIRADLFEASHTYKLKGTDQYLTLVEAQGDGRRYFKAWLSTKLEGPWQGLADSREKPFASRGNITQISTWTDSVSHGELLRSGTDENLEVNSDHLRFLFQGASDAEYRRQGYGGIPWRLGLLEQQ